MRLVLELVSPGSLLVDLGGLDPAVLKDLPLLEVGKLAIFVGSRPITLGECFRISRESSDVDELVLTGDTGRIMNAARGMSAGRLVVEGDAGPFAGAEMHAGELEIHGNAGDCVGAAMHAGLLRVSSCVGDWCGAALPGQEKGMDGGTILVEGNAGGHAGAGMRRGLLVIGGDCGSSAAERMLAGTVLCLGLVGSGAGVGMKRGSLVAGKSAGLLPGFLPAGAADPQWLRLYLSWLEKQHFRCQGFLGRNPPLRFTGDHLALGKGEVVVNEILE
jgi:formylmethanofuran dehydrogenase subunit C